jgi:hypothetical protein
MLIYKVAEQHINAVFPHIKHLLQKALDRGLGEITLDTIQDYCRNGHQQLWLGLDEEDKKIVLAFTTEIIEYPTRQRQLHLHLTGAEKHTIDKWWDAWTEPVEKFCKENGISYIHTTGRDGWEKALKHLGYKKYYTVLIKEIGND